MMPGSQVAGYFNNQVLNYLSGQGNQLINNLGADLGANPNSQASQWGNFSAQAGLNVASMLVGGGEESAEESTLWKAEQTVARGEQAAAESGTIKVFSSTGTSGGGSISLDEAVAAAERNGIDTRMFKLEYGGSDPRYFGNTSFTPTDLTFQSFKIVRAPDGRAIITLYDKGLTSEQAAVETIAHEINHIRGVFKTGMYTSEAAAEAAAEAAGRHLK